MRYLTVDQKTAIRSSRVKFVTLIVIDFPFGTERYTDAAYDFVHGGNTYKGAGGLVSIELPREDASLEAHACTLTAAGLTPAAVSIVLQERVRGSPVSIQVLLMDPDTNTAIGDPFVRVAGLISHLSIRGPARLNT